MRWESGSEWVVTRGRSDAESAASDGSGIKASYYMDIQIVMLRLAKPDMPVCEHLV